MKPFIFFILCSLGFNSIHAQTASANFENWTNYNVVSTSLQIANNWHGLDSSIAFYGFLLNPLIPVNPQIAKETPGNNGSAAAIKVITKNQSALDGVIAPGPIPSLASNASITVNTTSFAIDLTGGWPYTNNPVSISMWIKNMPLSGDSTGITAIAIDNSDGSDSVAATADTLLGATINSWTKITLPFKYSSSGFTTTLIRVLISSSGNFGSDSTSGAFTNLHDGTALIVDDIEIAAPNGLIQYLYSTKLANIYPTECRDNLFINLQNMNNASYNFQIFNSQGHLCKTLKITNLLNTMNLSELSSGNYFYNLIENNKIIQNGKFQKL